VEDAALKILVINVSIRPESPIKLFPVGLGYIITAMKNNGFDFDLIDIDAYRLSDQEIKELIGKKEYEVVCMGSIVTGYKIIKSLAAVIKEIHPVAKIIVGNSVATSIVDTLLTKTKVDIAVMGEGDTTIIDLLKAIEEPRPLETVQGICFKRDEDIIRNPPRQYIKDISSLPFLNFSLLDIEIYIKNSVLSISDPLPMPRESIRALPVNTARGCISQCTFCYHNFRGMPYRYRSTESIALEIEQLIEKYSLNYINFWDDLTFFSKKQILDLISSIQKYKLKFYWAGSCRGNLFKEESDLDILHKMKEAGCIGMGYALESSNQEILKAMHKNVSVEEFTKQTELFHKAGLVVWTTVVFGYPMETPSTIRKTFDCCIKNRLYPSSGYLTPQPGSEVYDYAVEHGFIQNEEEYLLQIGDRQDLRVNMTKMSNSEFESLIKTGLERVNQELGMGLDPTQLIKTQYYRSIKKTVNS